MDTLYTVAPSRGGRPLPARTPFEVRFRAAAVRSASVPAVFRGLRNPRTGKDGESESGYADRSARLLSLTLVFQVVGSLWTSPSPPGPALLRGPEGVGDALVGGLGLPVDALGIALKQDGEAVPGATSDLGGASRVDGHQDLPSDGHDVAAMAITESGRIRCSPRCEFCSERRLRTPGEAECGRPAVIAESGFDAQKRRSHVIGFR
jgi:hypothetical protein